MPEYTYTYFLDRSDNTLFRRLNRYGVPEVWFPSTKTWNAYTDQDPYSTLQELTEKGARALGGAEAVAGGPPSYISE